MLPPGAIFRGGFNLVDDPHFGGRLVQHGSTMVVLFTEGQDRRDEGSLVSRIIDVVEITLDPVEDWQIPIQCRVSGAYEKNMIALVRNPTSVALQVPGHAWRINIETKKAQVVDVDAEHVECEFGSP